MNVTLIPATEYRRERWKNGLGWTREVLRWPHGADDWDWRISIAEVDKGGPFSSFPGVERSFAVQAGREVRILVRPEEIDDLTATRLARDIVKKIEDNLTYPGQIKVTVIRETRAVEYAK